MNALRKDVRAIFLATTLGCGLLIQAATTYSRPVTAVFFLERTRVRLPKKRINRKHKKRRPDLFLSHSSKDGLFARTLSERLGRLGVDVWLDEWELEPADELRSGISEMVSRSRKVALVMSPAFLKSEWCRRELRLALAKERRLGTPLIVPILHKRAELPPGLRSRKYVDFQTGRYYRSLAELGGLFHAFGPRRLGELIRRRPPRSLTAVARIFEELGWNGFELLDSSDFDELAKLKGVEARGNKIEYYPAEVRRLNGNLSPRVRWLLRYA